MGGSDQVLLDAAALAARTQGTVTYQIATALQSTIGSWLDPGSTLICVMLLCMYTEVAAGVFRIDVNITRQVLLAQLGDAYNLDVEAAPDRQMHANGTTSKCMCVCAVICKLTPNNPIRSIWSQTKAAF